MLTRRTLASLLAASLLAGLAPATVLGATQNVSFTSTPPASPVATDTYQATAVTDATLSTPAITISIDPASSAICSVDGSGLVTFVKRGTCTIVATAAADANYDEATATQPVTVLNTLAACPADARSVVMNVTKVQAYACSDADGDTLAYSVVAQPAHGSASIDSATGAWTYDPTTANYVGADSFTVKANDGTGDSTTATVSLTVANSPVTASNATRTVPAIVGGSFSIADRYTAGTGEAGQPVTITAVGAARYGRVTTNGTTITYDPTRCSTSTDYFTYTVSDGRTTAQATVFVTPTRPASTPVTDSPIVPTFTVGSAITSTTAPVRVSWCGLTSASTTLRGYVVQQYTGTTLATLFASTTSTATSRSLPTNSSAYRWRVRTVDSAGRSSAYVYTATTRIARREDAATQFAFGGTWTRAYSTSFSGGTVRTTSGTGNWAQVTTPSLTNRQFAIVGTRGPLRGMYDVYVDGVKVGSVNQRWYDWQYRYVQFVGTLTPGTTHTIRIVNTNGMRIDLDAILFMGS